MTETIQVWFPWSAGTNINSRYMFKWISKYVIGKEAENTVSGQCFSSSPFLFCSFPVHSLWLSPFPHSWCHESKSFLYFNYIDGGESSEKFLSSHSSHKKRQSGVGREMLRHFRQVCETSDQTSSHNLQKYRSSKCSLPSKSFFPSTIRINCQQIVISENMQRANLVKLVKVVPSKSS